MTDSEVVHESNTDLGKGGEHSLHDYVLDEQLGLTCRLCNVVCIEAKDFFPPMVASNSNQVISLLFYLRPHYWLYAYFIFWQFTGKDHERPERNHFGQDGHVLDLSFFEICDPEFSKIKESGNVWASITDLEPKLLAHQRKAFEFIWKTWQDHYSLKKWMVQQVEVVVRLHILQERVKLFCWFRFLSVTWKFTPKKPTIGPHRYAHGINSISCLVSIDDLVNDVVVDHLDVEFHSPQARQNYGMRILGRILHLAACFCYDGSSPLQNSIAHSHPGAM